MKQVQMFNSKLAFLIVCLCCLVVIIKLLAIIPTTHSKLSVPFLSKNEPPTAKIVKPQVKVNVKTQGEEHKQNLETKHANVAERKEVDMKETVINETEFMIRMEKRMTERKRQLQKTCEKFGLWNQTLLKSKFVTSRQHKLLYCFIPKAGCTNWKKIILMLNGYSEEAVNKMEHNMIHALVARNYRPETVGIPHFAKNYIKFITVRNPLERLLSSFNDKFGLHPDGGLPQYAKTSVDMHKRYTQKNDENYLAIFEEFIGYISTKNHCKDYSVVANHWSTYNRICQPCTIKYDVIVHLETIEEDSRYLLKLIGVPKKIKYPGGYGGGGSSLTNSNAVLREFLNMTSTTLKDLYKAYEIDFHLFGYNPPMQFLQ